MSGELASWWMARAWIDLGAEAAHAIGVPDFMVNTQGKAAAEGGVRRGKRRDGWHVLGEKKVRRQRTPSVWLSSWGTRKVRLRRQRVPDELAS